MRWRSGAWGAFAVLYGCFNPDPGNPLTGTTSGTPSTADSTPEASSTSSADSITATGVGDSSTGAPVDCLEDADCSGLDGPCAEGICDGGTCTTEALADGTDCDDGLYCTENDQCSAGECVGDDRVCPSEGPCDVGECDEDGDACGTIPDPAMVDMPCDDGDPCTHDGVCTDGQCADAPDACAELNTDCQAAVCGDEGCEVSPANEGLSCNASNICATSTCIAGICTVASFQNENAACDDGLWCTRYEHCESGTCVADVADPCLGDQGCGMWSCDEAAQACVVAVPENEGGMCDDGQSCTAGTTCQMGECTGGLVPMELFYEPFADNSAGWALGAEWEIGPAQQTPCDQDQMCNSIMPSAFPGGDPDVDHTPTDDNGIAGVVIGGIVSQMIHPFEYIESPVVDGNVPGPLTLSYYRWLNSDYTPYMENRVEVFDGVTWQILWATGPSPAVADAPWTTASGMPGLGWTYQEFDITPFKNSQMRVRFGFNIDSGGVFPAPGWNIDDVRIAAAGCPDGP